MTITDEQAQRFFENLRNQRHRRCRIGKVTWKLHGVPITIWPANLPMPEFVPVPGWPPYTTC